MTRWEPRSQLRSDAGRLERRRLRATLAWRRLKGGWHVFAQSQLAIVGLVLIAIFGIMAIAHPILIATVWPPGIYDPLTGFDFEVMHPSAPSARHLLGTDFLGRDILSMLLAATAPSFLLGLTAGLTAAVIGTAVSATSAYYRGAVDALFSRLADVFLLLPAPILMVFFGASFRDLGPVPLGLIYGLAAGVGTSAIVIRAQALTVMAKPFIEAARVAGGGSGHIIFKHLLPHLIPMAALQMMLAVTSAIVADAFISFLGLTRLTTNWGSVVYSALTLEGTFGLAAGPTWHAIIPPSMAISLFASAFYLISRGLHQVADPRLRTDR